MQGWFHTEIPDSVDDAIARSSRKKQFTNGEETSQLEDHFKEKFSVKHAIYTNSGTSALAMALLAIGIKEGDEVIVPAIGWIATAQAVQLTGAKPIVVDTIENHTNLDIHNLKSLINNKTKAIIPVNYNGRQVDIQELKENIPEEIEIIEDSCKSMFSKSFNNRNYSGSNGICGCFSLGMISMLPSCYGGIIITNDSKIYEKLKIIKYHGVTYNPEIYKYNSFNFKTSNLFASMACEMFKSIDIRINKLKKIYSYYEERLRNSKYKLIPVKINDGEIPLLIDIYTKDKLATEVMNLLKDKNINTLGYHPPISSAEYLNKFDTPNADWLTERTFHLPCGPDQDFKNIDYAIEVLLKL